MARAGRDRGKAFQSGERDQPLFVVISGSVINHTFLYRFPCDFTAVLFVIRCVFVLVLWRRQRQAFLDQQPLDDIRVRHGIEHVLVAHRDERFVDVLEDRCVDVDRIGLLASRSEASIDAFQSQVGEQ